MPPPDVLVIGEALVDVVRTAAGGTYSAPGGSPANVAVGLSRLGVQTGLLTRLGRDTDAQVITEHLAENGVELFAAVDESATSASDADVDPDGNAGYAFSVHWELPDDALRGIDLRALRCVHTGSIAAVQSPGAEVVQRLVRQLHRTATISYDPNCRPSLMGDRIKVRRRVEVMLRYADVVKASDEDLEFLYPDVDAIESARWWAGLGPSLVVMTRGAFGYQAWNDGGTLGGSAVAVDVEDTVGAGDAFMSALLAGLHHRGLFGAAHRDELRAVPQEVLREVLQEAATSAAITCSRPGADPPSEAELAIGMQEWSAP